MEPRCDFLGGFGWVARKKWVMLLFTSKIFAVQVNLGWRAREENASFVKLG